MDVLIMYEDILCSNKTIKEQSFVGAKSLCTENKMTVIGILLLEIHCS
jgi:hypothetical protein